MTRRPASLTGRSLSGLFDAAIVALTIGAGQALGAEGLTIEVDDAQKVTIVGSSDSLRSTITDLCTRADVRLVAYEAEDRSPA